MKRYGGSVALHPTDLSAAAGQVTIIGGNNGSGKTTLLRILATLVTPDAGSVSIHGLDPVRQGRAVRAMTGLALVNERSVFWRLSVLENVELFARLRAVPRKTRRAHCMTLLEEVGLGALAHRDVFALSAGQRQRVVLARALVGDAPVLLSDEPLRGLDADAVQLVLEALRRRADAGHTVVIATPDPSEFDAIGMHSVVPVATAAAAGASV
jgi:ABC-2 type transport system ATP-binding protein